MTSEIGWNNLWHVPCPHHGHKQITEAISWMCLMEISTNGTPTSSGQTLTGSFLAMCYFCTYSIWLRAERKPECTEPWHLLQICSSQRTAGTISAHGLQPPSPTLRERKHRKEELLGTEKFPKKSYTQQRAPLIHPLSRTFCCVWACMNKYGHTARCLGSILHNKMFYTPCCIMDGLKADSQI